MEIAKSNSGIKSGEENTYPQLLPVKSNSGVKSKYLQATDIMKSERKNVSRYQTPSISQHTRMPSKQTLLAASTLPISKTNRFHPYQKSQAMTNSWNTEKNRPTHSKQNISSSAESVAHRKKETTRYDKAVLQRPASTATTLREQNQNRSKQYPPQHHETRPRYVNKFAEIEKLVEKQKANKDVTKSYVPLTTTTAWEPKMPTSDELIEFYSKKRKSESKKIFQ